MATRSIHHWFAEYGESHQNATNKLIHWICVPTIYFCVVGLLYNIPTPTFLPWPFTHVWAKAALMFVAVFYARTSWPIMLGMLLWSLACLALCRTIDLHAAWPLWAVSTALFVAAWLGQFYGHHI